MFNLDKEKLEFTLGNRAWIFWQRRKAENVVHFISDVEIWCIYLSLILDHIVLIWYVLYVLDSSEIKQLD